MGELILKAFDRGWAKETHLDRMEKAGKITKAEKEAAKTAKAEKVTKK